MSGTTPNKDEVERKIKLLELMIEKRRERVAYYNKLINMGLTFDDKLRLESAMLVKQREIRRLQLDLDWLYTQKGIFELDT